MPNIAMLLPQEKSSFIYVGETTAAKQILLHFTEKLCLQ
jgi:hypothetical protein